MARHFFAGGKGLLSNEEESLEVSAGDTGSEEALATLQAEGEAAEAEADAATDEASVTDGLEGVVALENMRLTLRAANENGGMDRFGAAMAKQHADFVLRKFLKSTDGLTMPSNESFGGAGSRVGSGVLTMESIKEKAGEIWKAIVKFLKKMKDKVMAWVHKLFGAGEGLVKRAKAVAARAEKAKSNGKSKPIDDTVLFNKIAVDGSADVGKYKAAITHVKSIADKMVTDSAIINKAIKKAIEDMGQLTAASTLSEVGNIRSGFENAIKTAVGGAPANEALPGNVKFRVSSLATATDPAVPFGTPHNGKPESSSGKVPCLDIDGIGMICGQVEAIGKTLIETRNSAKDSEEAYKNLEKFAAEQTKEGNLDEGATDAKGAHASTIALFKSMTGNIDGPIKALAGYCLKTGRLALDYCDASMTQLENKD